MKNNIMMECRNDSGKLRVAAYVRVATSDMKTLNRYQAQMRFYTEHIESRQDWEFAGFYGDVFVPETRRASNECEGGMSNE